MRGGDDAQIDRNRLDAADWHHRAFLDTAQQFRLNRQRQLADFVEKQRATVGTTHKSQRGGNCSGKRAFHVTEQLRFHQLGGKHRAIDRHKWAADTRTKRMNLPGRNFFANTRFAFNQDRGGTRRDQLDLRMKSRSTVGRDRCSRIAR